MDYSSRFTSADQMGETEDRASSDDSSEGKRDEESKESSDEGLVVLRNRKRESTAPIRPVAFVGDDNEEEIFNLVVYGMRFVIKSAPPVFSFTAPRPLSASYLSPASSIDDGSTSGDWTKEEDIALVTGIKARKSYKDIASHLNRPPTAVEGRANFLLKVPDDDHAATLSRKAWTAHEDALLIKGVKKLGRNYQAICEKFLPQRSAIAIKWRYKRFSKEQQDLGDAAPVKVAKLAKVAPTSSTRASPSNVKKSSIKRSIAKQLSERVTTSGSNTKRPRRDYKAMHEGTTTPEESPISVTPEDDHDRRPQRTKKRRQESETEESPFNMRRFKWTLEADDLLRQGIERFGNSHRQIVEEFFPERSVAAVCSRANKIFKHLLDDAAIQESMERSVKESMAAKKVKAPKLINGPKTTLPRTWSAKENDQLHEGVQALGYDYERIHKEYLPTRSAPAIEAKVQENAVKVETAKFVKELVVLPQRSGRLKWCPAEDALLESGIKMHGKNFEQIKAIYLPDRTVKALNVRAHKMFHDLVSKSPCF